MGVSFVDGGNQMKPNDITGEDIGKVVTFSGTIEQKDCVYREDADRHEKTGDLLAAPENMNSSKSGVRGWARYRILISKRLQKPERGVLLGRTFKMVGNLSFQEEVGWIFQHEGNVPVVMIQPFSGSVRFRKPVAVAEFEMGEESDS